MAQPYRNSLEHLFAELKRLDLMLRRAVLVARQARGTETPDEFRGLVIPEESINRILENADFLGDIWKLDGSVSRSAQRFDEELDHRQEEIRARMDASARVAEKLALRHLIATFNLSPAEVDIVLIAIAPELDPRYETVYAYLQNDVTRRHASVDLCLNLICRTAEEKIQARQALSSDSALLNFQLVELHEEAYDRSPTQLRKFVRLNDAVTRFLLEQQPLRTAAGRLLYPQSDIDQLESSAVTRAELQNLAKSIRRNGIEPAIVQLWGQDGSPLEEAALALGRELDKQVFYADLGQLGAEGEHVPAVVRDVQLWDNLLVVNRGSAPEEGCRSRASRAEETLLARVVESNLPLIMVSPDEQFGAVPGAAHLWRIHIEGPEFESRRHAWGQALNAAVADDDIDRLADLFTFSGQRVEQTVDLARSRATLRDPADPKLTMTDVLEAGRDLATPSVNQFAISIEPRFGWTDLVLPPEEMKQLRSVAARLQHRNLVHREWKFGTKLSRGGGLAVLLTGAPGTGKTIAAEVLAGALSMRLLQIDLAAVCSKYIGETQRNLSVIFREAERSQSLLFFDEADALFGKRTEVTDAHDRYANLEVNYLLQRIEQYQGLVVLATNFQENIDEAFLRRLHCVVRFPFPDARAREDIWKLQIPDQAPKAEQLDYAFLAEQFKLSGANIRNAALEAAFLAAQEEGEKRKISMQHVIQAIRQEHLKQGKLVMKTDLGRYARSV